MVPFFKARPRYNPEDNIVLRPYEDKDEAAVLSLVGERFKEIGLELDLKGDDADLLDIGYYWRKPGGDFVILERNDKIVGTLAARPLTDSSRAAEFQWFFLSQEAEGKGLSLFLLTWALGWCIQKNIRTIELWTGEKRWWAHKIYKKLGFTHNGVRKKVRDNPPYYLLYFELPLYKMDAQKALEMLKSKIIY